MTIFYRYSRVEHEHAGQFMIRQLIDREGRSLGYTLQTTCLERNRYRVARKGGRQVFPSVAEARALADEIRAGRKRLYERYESPGVTWQWPEDA